MNPQRIGIVVGTLGLLLATLAAVVSGVVAETEAVCPNHDPSYALVGVDFATLGVTYTDGCNRFLINPLVTAGALGTVLGVFIGVGGLIDAFRTAE